MGVKTELLGPVCGKKKQNNHMWSRSVLLSNDKSGTAAGSHFGV